MLITGGEGLLASALRTAYGEGGKGADVRSLSRRELDVTDAEALSARLRKEAPAVVIHLAAYTDVDGAEREPEACDRTNATAAGIAAREAAGGGARFVYVSTDFVFDGGKKEPYVEEDAPNPLGVYAKSKRRGELLVQAAHPRALVVRTQWLFGPDGENFVDKVLARAERGERFEVVADQFGCPSYAPDVARAILRLLEAGASGVYHCANHGVVSWFEFARAILRGAGLDEALVRPTSAAALARPAPRPAYSALRNLRLERTIGDPMRPWSEALAEYLRDPAERVR